MTDEDKKLLKHDYDGIRELDNSLPRWWLLLFIFAIAWSVVYFVFYHVLDIGYSSTDQYKLEMNPGYVRTQDVAGNYFGLLPRYRPPLARAHNDIVYRLLGAHPGLGVMLLTRDSDTTMYIAPDDPARIAVGADIFRRNCVSCHGNFGEGIIGPNLTDDYWLHGGDYSDVVKTVIYGVPAKGMVSWRGTLKPDEILDVAGYLSTLRGTHPANAKAPEGELISD